jgi:hypothetical protein
MSRRLLIGFIAALAVLVSAAPAVGGSPSRNRSPGCWATFPSSFTSQTKPHADGLLLGLVGRYGDGTFAGFARCNDGTTFAMVIMPDPGVTQFDRGSLGVGVVPTGGKRLLVWDPNCPSGCTVSLKSKTLPAWDGIVWVPASCVESIATKYTMFLPLAGTRNPVTVAPKGLGFMLGTMGCSSFKDCTGPYGLHEGDTATHEAWDAHQACTLR